MRKTQSEKIGFGRRRSELSLKMLSTKNVSRRSEPSSPFTIY
jgi:hypothetical protein